MVDEIRSAEDVLERNIQSMGGRDLLARIQCVRSKGKIKLQGLSGTIESAHHATHKTYQKIDLGVYQEESGFDGTIGWKRGTRGTTILAGAELVQARDSAFFNRNLSYRDPLIFSSVRLADGGPPADGRYAVEFELASGNQFRVVYDAETFLDLCRVDEVRSEGKTFQREVLFGDYRDVQGRRFPFKVSQITPFNQLAIEITEYQLDFTRQTYWWEDVAKTL